MTQRQTYVQYKRKTIQLYNNKEKARIYIMSTNEPRNFWQYITKSKQCKKCANTDINAHNFVDFKKLCSEQSSTDTQSTDQTFSRDSSLSVDKLDRSLTMQ